MLVVLDESFSVHAYAGGPIMVAESAEGEFWQIDTIPEHECDFSLFYSNLYAQR